MSGLLTRSAVYFVSSVAVAGIAFVTLPIATTVLGPAEYGSYAIGVSLASVVSGLAAASTGYYLPKNLPTMAAEERRLVLTSALLIVFGAGILAAILAMAVAIPLSAVVGGLGGSASLGIRLAILGAAFSSPWFMAIEVLTLDGRASAFSAVVIGQAATNAAVMLTALFLFELGGLSLFIGYLAGSLVTLAGALMVLRHDMVRLPSLRKLREMVKGASPVAMANLLESGLGLFERYYLALTTGTAAVGIFSHAQQYQNLTMNGVNAVSRSVWPINLSEARDERPSFPVTKGSWATVQMGITIVGLIFALAGREIIGLLTNGKFVEAQIYAALFMMVLLLQTAGKAHMALLVARGHGATFARLRSLSTAAGMLALLILVPLYGLAGAIAAVFLRFLVLRVGIVLAARRVETTPFLDHWVFLGGAFVIGGIATDILLVPDLALRLGLLGVLSVAILALGHRNIATFLRGRSGPSATDEPLLHAAKADDRVRVL